MRALRLYELAYNSTLIDMFVPGVAVSAAAARTAGAGGGTAGGTSSGVATPSAAAAEPRDKAGSCGGVRARHRSPRQPACTEDFGWEDKKS